MLLRDMNEDKGAKEGWARWENPSSHLLGKRMAEERVNDFMKNEALFLSDKEYNVALEPTKDSQWKSIEPK